MSNVLALNPASPPNSAPTVEPTVNPDWNSAYGPTTRPCARAAEAVPRASMAATTNETLLMNKPPLGGATDELLRTDKRRNRAEELGGRPQRREGCSEGT